MLAIKKEGLKLPYVLLFFVLVGFLATHTPNVEYDIDPSYILFGASRPPLYPFFIWLFHWAGPWQFNLIIWIQGLFLFSTLLYARHWLKTKLQLPEVSIFLVCVFVLLTIAFHFQIWFIQSEGLAFPVFILTFFTLIDCFYQFSLKRVGWLAILVSLLILTRLQFSYLYALFALLCLWYLHKRVALKSVLAAGAILFGSMGFTTLIDHSYHYTKHGFFGVAPYSGLMVLVQTLYLADNDAASYFTSPSDKNLIQTMINQRNHQHLNQDADIGTSPKLSFLQHAYQTYSNNYLSFQEIIDNTLQTSVESNSGIKTNFQANVTALRFDKVLITHEFKKNLFFLFWKFIQCMGGVPLFLFFLILLLAIPISITQGFAQKFGINSFFVAITTLVTFLNAAMVSLFNPDLPVYFCYSQFMFYCLAAFLVTIVQNSADFFKLNQGREYVKSSIN